MWFLPLFRFVIICICNWSRRFLNQNGGKLSEPCLFCVELNSYSLKDVKRSTMNMYWSRWDRNKANKDLQSKEMRLRNQLQSADIRIKAKENKIISDMKNDLGIDESYAFKSPIIDHMRRPKTSSADSSPSNIYSEIMTEQYLSMTENNNDMTGKQSKCWTSIDPYYDHCCQLQNKKSGKKSTYPVYIPLLSITSQSEDNFENNLECHAGKKGLGWRKLNSIASPFTVDYDMIKNYAEKCVGDHIFQTLNSRSVLDIVNPVSNLIL